MHNATFRIVNLCNGRMNSHIWRNANVCAPRVGRRARLCLISRVTRRCKGEKAAIARLCTAQSSLGRAVQWQRWIQLHADFTKRSCHTKELIWMYDGGSDDSLILAHVSRHPVGPRNFTGATATFPSQRSRGMHRG